MSSAVGAINAQIRDLAPVLNTPSIGNAVGVSSSSAATPVDVMAKRYDGSLYVFAVAMRDAPTTATFTLRRAPSETVEVLGESRTLSAPGGVFSDSSAAYGVHLYRLGP